MAKQTKKRSTTDEETETEVRSKNTPANALLVWIARLLLAQALSYRCPFTSCVSWTLCGRKQRWKIKLSLNRVCCKHLSPFTETTSRFRFYLLYLLKGAHFHFDLQIKGFWSATSATVNLFSTCLILWLLQFPAGPVFSEVTKFLNLRFYFGEDNLLVATVITKWDE